MKELYLTPLVFACFQFINAFINVVFGQKIKGISNNTKVFISILIPARNEEQNIGNLLESLIKTTDSNTEIIVLNDHSTDKTAEIVKYFANKDLRVKLIDSQPLPNDWLGKNYACYQLSQVARGDYLLFIDADVKINGEVISDAIAYLKKNKLGLLSIFPKQIMVSWGEKFSVPIMNYILLTLLPLILVRISPFRAHAAANGQFMLFDAQCYKRLNPHEVFKQNPVEDIAIARFFKKNKIKVACITGEERVQCQMYNSYQEALNGFSKNIFVFFGNSPLLAFSFWTLAFLGVLPIVYFYNEWIPIYITLVITTVVLYARACRQNIWMSIFLLPINLFFMLHVMIVAMVAKKQKSFKWKGRNIYR
ncbi:MAG: glycosyltransferase family 2 protein [Bacteroidales bacterium]|nr:glycosyltransferase family 2 protein [Bacteroidales bacterium]